MRLSVLIVFFLFSITSFSQQKDSILIKLKTGLNDSSNKHEKIKALIDIGKYEIDRKFNNSKKYFLDAQKIIESCGDDHQSDMGVIFTQLGVINRRESNYGDALNFYFKAKEIYQQLKDTSKYAEVIHNTALLYRFQDQDKKAIINYKVSLDLSKKMRDTFNMAATYNMMGVSYRRLNNIDSAFICYKQARNYFNYLKREEDIRGVDNNLATLYATQKKYSKSLPIKLNNLNYYKKIGNKSSMIIGYYNVSKDFSGLNKHKYAIKYADSSLTIAKELGFRNRISKAHLRKSAIYRDVKDFENAYRSYRSFKKYSDSIFSINSIQKIKEFELKRDFEIEKREVEINTKEQKARNQFYFFFLTLLLVLGSLITFLMRRNYKGKIKYVAAKLEKEKFRKELLNEKVKVSEAELKWLIADNQMRKTYLSQFYDTLKIDYSENDINNIKEYIKNLRFKLKQQINTEDKLSAIQSKINETNKGFESLLISNYPSLTKSEREVSYLLRINLSIKEMASIRNTTIDSIKSIRYRIRKKLAIPKGMELESFIKKIK
jgi:DNA-binding CsgD family transcriptional regulator